MTKTSTEREALAFICDPDRGQERSQVNCEVNDDQYRDSDKLCPKIYSFLTFTLRYFKVSTSNIECSQYKMLYLNKKRVV